MNNSTDSHQTRLSASCLLLSVAEADEILAQEELDTIRDILIDFFSISNDDALKLLNESQTKMKNALGLFEFGQYLNTTFDHSDKLDFISCIFEIAFSDGNLHYLEHHTIKKIADILHLSREEIISSKHEVEKYMN